MRLGRRAARLLGLAALAVSLGYLGTVAVRHAASLPPIAWTFPAAASVAGAAVLYLLALAGGAVAWHLLLRAAGARPPLATVLIVSALAQVGKYVPGNVGQYLGRTALARRYGVAWRQSALTLVIETAGLIAAAAACAVLFGARLPAGRSALLAAAVGIVGVALLLLAIAVLKRRFPTAPPVPSAGALLACLALYAAGFVCGGGALDLLARGLFAARSDWKLAIPAFALSWVAGFVTPGAPGGLGVREALLVAATSPFYGARTALSTALVFRAVSLLGDGLAFLAGLAARRRWPPAAGPADPS